jgi:SpoVK/Ycf46/Vps4 family AAA+-type ATPase
VVENAQDPNQALDYIGRRTDRAVYVLRDLHKWFDPIILRKLRTLSRQLQTLAPSEARAIVLLTPSGEVPPELSSATVIEYPLPDRAEVARILDDVLGALPDELRASAAPNGKRDAAIDSAVGLTAEEIANCYAKSLVSSRKVDPALVANEKRRVIARERVLTWHDPDPRGLDAIGGLDLLKQWLTARRAAFSPKARAFGLPAPKGALLVGLPGCGKSLTAKAIAAAWQMPLLRLDMGALKSKYVGDSEANIRKALAVAEAVSPCILWLDEMEKALAGATGAQGDGGVSADALGAVLSWMQERQGSVFVIATANDVRALPPELLRKGRFDELFWVDLPTSVERSAIISATLRQYDRTTDGIDLAEIVRATEGFTGAEIAALIPDALFAAFADGERAITTADLSAAASTVSPLSKTAAERIQGLRDWSKGRARPASTPEASTSSVRRALDL